MHKIFMQEGYKLKLPGSDSVAVLLRNRDKKKEKKKEKKQRRADAARGETRHAHGQSQVPELYCSLQGRRL